MTRRTLAALPSQLCMAAFVGVSLGYVDLHLYYSGAISFPAAYIFLAVLLGFCAVVLVRAGASARLREEIIALYVANVSVLGAFFAILGCGLLFAFLPDAYWKEGPQYLLFPAYDMLVVLFAMLLPVLKHHRQHFDRYVLCAFVVFITGIFIDAYSPGTFSLVPDRAAGFAENPNTAGFVLVLLCCCVVDFERERRRNLVVLALTSLGVLATLSRGAVVLITILFAFYVYRVVCMNRYRMYRLFQRGAALAGLLVAVFGTGIFLVNRAEMFALSYQPRLAMLSGSEQVVSRDDDRIEVLKMHLAVLARSPVVGYGTGYTYSLPTGPHNIYVQQWINNGLPGLAAYLMLIAACAHLFWKRRYHRGLAFVALVFVYGFFNHNVLEERAFLMLLGVLLTVSFYETLEEPCFMNLRQP